MNFLKIRAVAASMGTEDLVHFCSFISLATGMPKLDVKLIKSAVGKSDDWAFQVLQGTLSLNSCERACLLAAYMQICVEAGFIDLLESVEG